VPLDLALAAVSLRFDPERLVVSLDEESTPLEVVASAENDGVTTPAAGLHLVLTNESGDPLGTAITDAGGRARFVVSGDKLGAPGPGEIRVAFAGSHEAGATAHTMPVERRTRVDLSAPEAPGGRLPAGYPEEGVVVPIIATPRCAARAPGRGGCRALPTGMVEVRTHEGGIVGAASLERGSARVVATFPLPVPMPADAEVPLRARYVADTPWFQPGADLVLAQPVRAPSGWTRLPLLLAGAAALGWLVLARFAPGSQAAASRSASRRAAPPERPQAQVAVVSTGRPEGGWTGRVVDAHEARPVQGARVAVERRGFERIEIVAETTTDAAGAFALPTLHTRPGDELVAEGSLHAALRRPMPPPGELAVQLILRRRAVIERLIAWARRRGKPYDARPEPTPGHVRRAATGEIALARWADAVERAAFGGGVVDRRIQEEIDQLAPPGVTDIPEELSPDGPRPPRETPERPRR
jgi:hypothetical protein